VEKSAKDLVEDIAEKMVRNQMKSDKAQTELVNKLLDEIEKN
jgi:hypothetical protein